MQLQISQPGLFSRGKIKLNRPGPHITPDSLLAELTTIWKPQGFEVYKSALVGVDVVLKKSGWTGVALKIKQNNGNTELAYNAFAPSAFVRVMAMGLIPILIVNANSWKPLLRRFEQYVQGSPYFGGQLPAGQQQAQLPAGQPQQQAYGQQPMQAQPQAGYAQQQQQPQQQAQQQYPCQRCQQPLQWVAQHQRWYCGSCQQYV
jgi:ribosomal protein S27AE